MIIGIDGISGTGKSHFVKRLFSDPELKDKLIYFRGAGAVNIGFQHSWKEYNFWLHNIIENLDKQNDYKKPIIWERFLAECIYNQDDYYSIELLRVIKSHKNKKLIYFRPIINNTEDVEQIENRNGSADKEIEKFKLMTGSNESIDFFANLHQFNTDAACFSDRLTINLSIKNNFQYTENDLEKAKTFIKNSI